MYGGIEQSTVQWERAKRYWRLFWSKWERTNAQKSLESMNPAMWGVESKRGGKVSKRARVRASSGRATRIGAASSVLPPHCYPLYRGLVFPMEARLIPCLLYESANDNESTTTINSDCSRSSLTITLLSLCYSSLISPSFLLYSITLCTAPTLLISTITTVLSSLHLLYSYL